MIEMVGDQEIKIMSNCFTIRSFPAAIQSGWYLDFHILDRALSDALFQDLFME